MKTSICVLTAIISLAGCINIPRDVNINLPRDRRIPPGTSRDHDSPGGSGRNNNNIFYGMDVLTPPNRMVELTVRFTGYNRTTRVAGRNVQFFNAGKKKPLGSAVTDQNGYATIRVRISKQGVYKFHACIDGNPNGRSFTTDIFLMCRPANSPVVIVTTDRAIMDSSRARIMLLDGGKPRPRSASVLTKLARQFTVVYVTNTTGDLSGSRRKWMTDHGFPAGCILLAARGRSNRSEVLSDLLQVLSKDFPRIEAGIVEQPDDIEACCRAGIRKTVWIPHFDLDDPDELRETADMVRDCDHRHVNVVKEWRDIPQVLTGSCICPPDRFADQLEDLADRIEDREHRDD